MVISKSLAIGAAFGLIIAGYSFKTTHLWSTKNGTIYPKAMQSDFSEKNTKEPLYYSLKNDTINIKANLNKINALQLKFEIVFVKNKRKKVISGVAKLIRFKNEEGGWELPEGSPIFDENKKVDYVCDSVYSFSSKAYNISLGFQKKNKKRLSLTVGKYDRTTFLDGDFTLYKKQYEYYR
ncbi:hypothetical protein ACQ33O_00930 [Ferruginibacter sp. SUN002]|uniref:hypothetical protein n=1 Tax=Ferruginibacter sp. SUN002 TaxID=2937789 RepID=UPI003D365AC0